MAELVIIVSTLITAIPTLIKVEATRTKAASALIKDVTMSLLMGP